MRGRGGAGFPAGTSGSSPRKSPGEDKFIVANGDEGDPGSYIDKYLMERNPELLLEGMALAGYAVGASHGFVLTPLGVPAAPSPRSTPPSQGARAAGLLGEDILGSGFAFDVTVVEGAGSYVVGEETALLACLQGLRGTVSARPPFPAERGLLRAADGRQQRRDALQHPLHRARAAPRPTARSARTARPPAASSSASTSASREPTRRTRCRSA